MVTTCIPNMNNIQLFMCEGSQKYTTVSYDKNRHKCPIMAQSQTIFYAHKVFMMVYHCTQHEQNPLIHLGYIATNIQNVWYNGHICYIVAESQGKFYMCEVPRVMDDEALRHSQHDWHRKDIQLWRALNGRDWRTVDKAVGEGGEDG